MTWMPQPGTLPHRAIAWLQQEGSRKEFAAAVICEELGIETTNFSTCMKPARVAGLVHTRKDGRLLFWRLGDGTPDLAAAPKDEPEDEEREPAAAPTDFNAAIWADGDLDLYGLVELDDGGHRLSRDQVAQIKRLISWMPA